MLALERMRNPSKDRKKIEEKEDMVTMSSAGLKGGKEDASASTRSATRCSLSSAKATIWSTNLSSLKSARLRSRLQRVGSARKFSRMGKALASCRVDLASKKEEISSSNSGESPASLSAPPGIVVDDTGFKR